MTNKLQISILASTEVYFPICVLEVLEVKVLANLIESELISIVLHAFSLSDLDSWFKTLLVSNLLPRVIKEICLF